MAQIEILSCYEKRLEFDMPDKYLSSFIEIGMVRLILEDMTKYARADPKTPKPHSFEIINFKLQSKYKFKINLQASLRL